MRGESRRDLSDRCVWRVGLMDLYGTHGVLLINVSVCLPQMLDGEHTPPSPTAVYNTKSCFSF